MTGAQAVDLYVAARAELQRCAELLQSLAVVDLSRDHTKDAVRLARMSLSDAAGEYCAAVNAIREEDARRRQEQAEMIAAGPMAALPPNRSEEDSAA